MTKTASKKVVQINRFRAGGYDGASTAPRTYSWRDSNVGPNSALTNSQPLLRARSRAGYRNNPYFANALNSLVTNEVGAGITPRSLSETHKDTLNAYWADVIQGNVDSGGILNFSAMLAQIAMARRMSGEVFIRKRVRRYASSASPLQLQILESEFVPSDLNRDLENGNKIKAGIEFNKRDQRVAYWFYTEHPNEYRVSSRQYVRILARDVIHHYRPTRPGQLRGEPDATQSIVKGYTLDKYEDAELERKESKSNYTGAVYRDPLVFESDEDDTKVQQGSMSIQAKSLVEMLPGETIDLFNGDDTGSGYDEFMTRQLMAVAAGFGVPYELLSGDWSKINDRLLRGVLNEFRRAISMDQGLLEFQVCEKAWQWAIEAGILTGKLSAPGYATNQDDYLNVEWSTDAWAYTNPVQDVQARVMEQDNGLQSRQRIIADRGGDAEVVDKQRKEDQDREEELDLKRDPPEPVSDVSDTGNPKENKVPDRRQPTR